MSADWSKPSVTDVYANVLAFLNSRLNDLALGLASNTVPAATNLPVGAIRWNYNSGTPFPETYSGSAWAAFASSYSISITGNAATATVAAAAPWAGITGKPTTVAGYGISDIQSYVFPSTTRMLFAQAAAPTGWTQDTSDNASNRMLRVVNTAGGGVGGSASPILNNVVPAHTHGITTGSESADHTHTGSTGTESAAHSHALGFNGGVNWSVKANTLSSSGACYDGSQQTGTESASHTHPISLGGASATHTHSGTTDAGSSQTNWQPRYLDLIVCSKN